MIPKFDKNMNDHSVDTPVKFSSNFKISLASQRKDFKFTKTSLKLPELFLTLI